MIALIQRTKHAHVSVNNHIVGQIESGLLLLLGIEKEDTVQHAERLCHKVLNYRVFNDHEDKMNLNIKQAKGNLLVVSQFTLAANTTKGLRPSFSTAASPQNAQKLYDYFIELCQKNIHTETGIFAEDMQISLINDGPVSFWLQT